MSNAIDLLKSRLAAVPKNKRLTTVVAFYPQELEGILTELEQLRIVPKGKSNMGKPQKNF